jgi:1-acyl-sn-glycerol-3-phosphate acyltransferase
MLYQLLKILMTAALRFFYRHIYIDGLHHVPASGPCIIIANHPSSLMDAALLGIVLKRPVYFFTRGDVFVNKWVNKILSCLHMIPVHNHENGRSSLHNNNNAFQKGQQLLLKGSVLVFFPESNSHVERHLLPFRKGVFRLAFQTMQSNGFRNELPIVPIGITYEHPTKSDTTVLIKAGLPLLVSGYVTAYEKNAAAALLQLAKTAYERMRQLVLHINDRDFFNTAETVLLISRNNQREQVTTWKIGSAKPLQQQQQVCTKINNAGVGIVHQLKAQANLYNEGLKKNKLNDETLLPSFAANQNGLMTLVLLPFAAAGYLLNALPVLAAKVIVRKMVRRIDFYSWLFVCISALLYLLWWLLLLIMVGSMFGWTYAVGLAMAGFITGLMVLKYRKYRQAALQSQLLKKTGEERVRLQNLRTQLAQFDV